MERLTYADTYEMVFDPNLESGTMVGADPQEDPPVLKGGGLGGVWVGAKGTPFSQKVFTNRPDRVTMLLDLGYRFKDASNFYTASESGTRGAGTGSAAWRFRAAFSTTHRTTEPYLVLSYQRDLNLKQDIRDESGTTLSSAANLNPADDIGALAGAEVLVYENEAQGSRVAIDFFARLGYRSWQDVPSGIYLPSVVANSYGQVVTQSEALYGRGGLGVDWRLFEYVQWNVAGDVGTHTAQRMEHPYTVRSGIDNLDFAVFTNVRIRLRDAKTAIASEPLPD
jgi:hypothetical protein